MMDSDPRLTAALHAQVHALRTASHPEVSIDIAAAELGRHRRRPRDRRRWAVPVAVAASVAAVVTSVAAVELGATAPKPATLSPAATPKSSSPAALQPNAVLHELAAAAATHPKTIKPGQYWHLSDGTGANDIWVSADPTGPWLWHDGNGKSKQTGQPVQYWFSGTAGTTLVQLSPGGTQSLDSQRGHKEPFVPAYPNMVRCPAHEDLGMTAAVCPSLPPDPEKLLRELSSAKPLNNFQFMNPQQVAFQQIEWILGTGLTPNELRGPLIDALALLPAKDVTITQNAVSALGRRGIGVSIDTWSSQWGVREQLIFDPGTGDLINTSTVALGTVQPHTGPALKQGTVLGNAAQVITIVDKLPQVPQGER